MLLHGREAYRLSLLDMKSCILHMEAVICRVNERWYDLEWLLPAHPLSMTPNSAKVSMRNCSRSLQEET